ncbi:MAG: serine/threonine-protein kinase [Pseudomonadota bacterium]
MSSTETNPQERWQLLQDSFEAALEIAPEARADWLAEQALPADVLEEVSEMLAAHDGPALSLEAGVGADQPPDSIGVYEVLRSIGQGGMGEVFLARRSDGSFDREVAIKTLSGWVSTPAARSRFLQERRIHARLEHPNITRLLDAGLTDQGLPYLVMDYVDGVDIVTYSTQAELSPRQRVRLLLAACDAVAFAHSRLVLHRDIKPTNILVTEAGEVRLLDFGIAKLLVDEETAGGEDALTRPGEHLMTLRYASPEQVRGEALDVTCDVYSLGVVLFELLTGSAPFDAKSQWELSEQIVHQPPRFSTLAGTARQVEDDLKAICLKAMEKETAQRYASAAELAEDLRRYLSYRSISARRPGVWVRLQRLFQRHPVATPLSALAVIAILSGGLAAAWQAQQAQRERDEARAQRDRAEQVTEVLVDLFDSDPYAEADRRRDDITLREFLVRRAADISDELADQPLLRAQLQDLLANLLTNLSLIEDAEPLALNALAIRRAEAAGNNSLPLARSVATLGNLRQAQGRFSEAEQLHREALAMRQRLLPPNDPLVVTSLNDLSVVLYAQRTDAKEAEALELDRQVLEINIDRFGPQSLQAAQSYNNLGALFVQRGRDGDRELAAPLLRQALEIRRERLGPDHPNTANSAANLANLLHDMGQLEAAGALFDEAIESTRQAMGEGSTRVADLIYGFGFLLMDLERWQEASDRFSEAVNIYEASLPPDHPYIADARFVRGQAVEKAGQVESASEDFLTAMTIYRQHADSLDSELRATVHYARSLSELGDETRAASVARAGLARADGSTDPKLREALAALVEVDVSASSDP